MVYFACKMLWMQALFQINMQLFLLRLGAVDISNNDTQVIIGYLTRRKERVKNPEKESPTKAQQYISSPITVLEEQMNHIRYKLSLYYKIRMIHIAHMS